MATRENSRSSARLMEELVELSQFYGANPDFVLAGGGNTSAKAGNRLFVKASGCALASVTADGFVEMDRLALERILNTEPAADRDAREARFKADVLAARVQPEKSQRPSVEVVLHHLFPRTFVVHTHPTIINVYTCCENGQAIIEKLLGDTALWVPDVDPGLMLAQTLQHALQSYTKRTGRDCPQAVLMQNHGVVIGSDTPEEVKELTTWLVSVLHSHLAEQPQSEPFGALSKVPKLDVKPLINSIAPALRALLADGPTLKTVRFDDSPEIKNLVTAEQGQPTALGGPLCPDQIVYCKSLPAWYCPSGGQTGVIDELKELVSRYRDECGFPPQVVLVQGLGMFTAGDDITQATISALVYRDAVKVMAGARRLGDVRYMPKAQRDWFEHWEVEAYRRGVAKSAAARGLAAGKIAFVTGAAQGFGCEIAADLAAQGAQVILADLNFEGAAKAVREINTACGAERTLAVSVNVTDPESVEEAVHRAVCAYGGFDLFISNAGVLKAGSVKSQPIKDFEFVTAVNYSGYFIGVQKAAPIMAIAHKLRPDYWSDIIQINSKSGLAGSNKNGAYAGSKFGGIGLTQSFALELVEDGIKVNSICPGNFFEGPLWSDPVNGLFVQYLNSGKIPGAKTVEDVKRAYEQKIPMRRGCRTADVMKAVYYLLSQQYETGQAVPVTGGQVMLS